MATKIDTYQCPACNGPLQYAAGSGKMECEYCGSSYEVAQIEAMYAKETAPQLTCPSCGVALNFDADAGEAACPGCGAEFDLASLRAYAAEENANQQDNMTWDTEAGSQWQAGEADGLRLYSCTTSLSSL